MAKEGTYSLKMSIISAFAGLFLFLVLLIVGFNYYFGMKTTMESARRLFAKSGETAIIKTMDFLGPAVKISRLFERQISLGQLVPDDHEQIVDYAVEAMRVYPQFNGVYYGADNGSWGAEKVRDGVISRDIRLRKSPTDKMATWKTTWIDKDNKVLKEDERLDPFDTRTRPWYIAVKKKLKEHWSEPYLFIANETQIGISATVPVLDKQGEFVGSTLVDITMGALSRFLADLKLSDSSLIFIIDGNGRLVCFPEMKVAISQSVDGEMQLKHISEMLGFNYLIDAYAEYCKTRDERIIVDSEEGTRIVQFIPFPKEMGKDWKLVISALEKDFTGEVKETNQLSILVSLVILLLSTLFISQIAKSISRPINVLTEQLNQIKDLKLEESFEIRTRIGEISDISASIESLRLGLKAFKKYVPAGLVKDLVATGETARLGGKNEILTVFFSDIESFTPISEDLPPEYLGQHLSEYLDELSKIITSCGGTIDKYIGDSIMAFWGAPHLDMKQEYNACRAAILCQRRLQELEEKWAAERKPLFKTRIGIHTGPTVVGNIGSKERMNYTVIGDSVNLASRLEGVNKKYGTRIIISQTTAERVSDHFLMRALGMVRVKGKNELIQIFELMDFDSLEEKSTLHPLIDLYNEAYQAYLNQQWDLASAKLNQLLKQVPGDAVSIGLLKRVDELKANPPASGEWTGIVAGTRSGDIA